MLDMRCRALFYLWKVPRGNAVLVVDRDGPVSVTNDAENVVGYVLCGHPNKPRILYNRYAAHIKAIYEKRTTESTGGDA
jgi:hypothetical protein